MTQPSLPWRDPQTGTCPVADALYKLSGKYKPQILHCLTQGEVHFLELQRMMPNVSHKTLTAQLRDLEQSGLVLRQQKDDARKRVGYRLSPAAQALVPILHALFEWSMSTKTPETTASAGRPAVNI